MKVIRTLCLTNTFHLLADQSRLSVNTIKNIAQDLFAELASTVHFETPAIVGIHEISLAGANRFVITNLRKLQWMTVKRATFLRRSELEALAVIRRKAPYLAQAYDLMDAFLTIYDAPDKRSAMRAFDAWEQSLPEGGADEFHSLAKTIHGHRRAVFAYWDSPTQTTNAYAECMEGLIKLASNMGTVIALRMSAPRFYIPQQPVRLEAAYEPSRDPQQPNPSLKRSNMALIFRLWLNLPRQAALHEKSRIRRTQYM